jgi:hypothetical protein
MHQSVMERLAGRCSPRTCGWIVYGILALCALGPSILASFTFGIWAFFPTIVIMLGASLPLLPWILGEASRQRSNRRVK